MGRGYCGPFDWVSRIDDSSRTTRVVETNLMDGTPDQTNTIAAMPETSTVQAPNWDLVPFDVACARCGHDLRGLTDPVCPACKLEFDWSVAVPIEHLIKCAAFYATFPNTYCCT